MRDRKRPYLAYLVRLWQVWDKGQTGWRASVENAHTGERQGFASLADLFTFLENESGQVAQVRHASNMDEELGDIDKVVA